VKPATTVSTVRPKRYGAWPRVRRASALSAAVIAGGALMALELRAYTAGAVCRLAAAIGHACRLAAADAASRHRAWLAGAVERVLALSPACVTGPAGSMPSACRVGIEPLNEVQVMAVEVLLLLLLFALPLWMAQHRARTLHIAQLSQAALASDLKACKRRSNHTSCTTRWPIRAIWCATTPSAPPACWIT
jgi:hypothetical protein